MLNGTGAVSIFFIPSYREVPIPKEGLIIRGDYKKELFWLLFVLTPFLFSLLFRFDPPFLFF
ncbi:MAG: hypothetical protein EBT03_09540 [Betaproteobacteria bacterium]|nr:hypothetical protein [Betaproteobacteria bacterium]